MLIRNLNVGGAATYEYDGREVSTGFFKYPAVGPVSLSKTGFDGDTQADLVHHGGPEKAVLLYAAEHYGYWAEELGRDPGPAFLGENLTVEGLSEATACIGDVYQVGEAVIQICQPRVPCYKTNIRAGIPDMLERILACGFTGFYARVLTEGRVQAGDAVVLLSRPAGAPTVAQANDVRYRQNENRDALQALLAAEGLAAVWQEWLRKRLG